MSSMIKTFYNNWLYHTRFPELADRFQPDEVRFTKVLTKYSTEYNNQLFLYNMCQELDMDKKDVVAFFQELRLLLGISADGMKMLASQKTASAASASVAAASTATVLGPGPGPGTQTVFEHLDELFQATDINRLDIKRMYRFLDKNSDTFDLIGGKKVSTASMVHMEEYGDEGGDEDAEGVEAGDDD